MHELGIATSILDIVRQHVPDERGGLVRRVRVRIGELAGVVPETLEFCFSVAVEGTAFRSAVLHIEHVPMKGLCKDCGTAMSMREPVFWCPECGSPRVQLVSGREMQVEDVELDDEPLSVPAGAQP
jgi:hydrogenase nickel incorporation protein HypA/HybF